MRRVRREKVGWIRSGDAGQNWIDWVWMMQDEHGRNWVGLDDAGDKGQNWIDWVWMMQDEDGRNWMA
jgi:hypothetical protein